MKKIIAFVIVICLVSFAGCRAKPVETNSDVSSQGSQTVNKEDLNNGVSTAYPDEKYGFQLDAPKAGETVAIMHTTMGDISIRLFDKAAPKAVENFTTHAKEGYYDGLIFHRIINDFMIQGGDPDGNGTGGESIWKEPFEDEFDQKLMNLRGSLSMANSGINTNGSQFFINQATPASFNADGYKEYNLDSLVDAYTQQYESYKLQYGTQFSMQYPDVTSYVKSCSYPVSDWVPQEVWDLYEKTGGNIHLDGAWRFSGGHTVFGQVYEGMDVVDAIAAVEVDSNDKPVKDVKIESVEIIEYKG